MKTKERPYTSKVIDIATGRATSAVFRGQYGAHVVGLDLVVENLHI